VAERLPAAAAALRRGDFDAATSAYLHDVPGTATDPAAGCRRLAQPSSANATGAPSATRFTRPLLARPQ